MKILISKELEQPKWNGLKIMRMIRECNWEYTTDINDTYDIAINADVNETPKHLYGSINGELKSVLKSNIDKVHKKVFGYGVLIDPTKFNTFCVEKFEFQAFLGQKIVKCPLRPSPNKVYAKLIDTTTDTHCRRDIRVIWMKGIQWVIYKDKPIDMIFANHTEFKEVLNEFSNNEVKNINNFCRELRLDYGELDILRSNYDGKIYIIDVNNLPGDGLFGEVGWIEKYSTRFKEVFYEGVL